jgi:hypothetical protein
VREKLDLGRSLSQASNDSYSGCQCHESIDWLWPVPVVVLITMRCYRSMATVGPRRERKIASPPTRGY